ncbi:hypothetical protein A3H65_00855 [Candidatus Giovannonibacteria bacterium RIFCSPLOWO2_02_FULL_45_14]|uniref:Uncharacterized protein n=1 Tax=Candidatus Giovannonibacteria bacterium RIFCSPLOWO2_12_FULL_44_15 TaxID=1798364 RepID=A0A1F5XZ44_9BACT|nr:MAG: hypothetical protein A3C75_02125 [Candidatus Giovannonibacteria bacterium RIFCSPHIGHO2_02_FULL_44_31]OGF77110.1 MAG: hypothetical protein A3E62_01625 [Candidatus Giovannonibacteria bacterium RIFCSPHIGHO2_12_FULL_44_29]OGF91320.1 MAG: hypothetical protein A3H65_00855 [Candidatus Giovannonibacteria bacterium RIFCSPLOWO2_02_FULL_45_14]OGF93143.1 MAG: hypothetical protein A3G54_03195 [Candidatus Giovannonibacteria bacterium RIFCSPLOWO2_12_FULL_44_15]
MERIKNISLSTAVLLCAGIILIQALALSSFGQPPICECGYVKFWEGVVLSSGNSQHLTDWYTPSHIIHGFLFYLLAWYLFPRSSVGARLLFALAIESGWEVFENTPWLINHYRQQALAQGYIGDSIINSVFDTMSAALGFIMARKLPTFAIVVVAIALELYVGFMIRDNLTLNTANLIYQFDFIKEWQSGGQ